MLRFIRDMINGSSSQVSSRNYSSIQDSLSFATHLEDPVAFPLDRESARIGLGMGTSGISKKISEYFSHPSLIPHQHSAYVIDPEINFIHQNLTSIQRQPIVSPPSVQEEPSAKQKPESFYINFLRESSFHFNNVMMAAFPEHSIMENESFEPKAKTEPEHSSKPAASQSLDIPFPPPPTSFANGQPVLTLSPEFLDLLRGGTHGVFQALAIAAINPLDQFHARAVAEFKEGRLKLSWWSNYKNLWSQVKENPYKGASETLKVNMLRNSFVFAIRPALCDGFEDGGLKPIYSKALAGLVTGGAEAALTAVNKAQVRNDWLEKQASQTKLFSEGQKKSVVDSWKKLPKEAQKAAIKEAFFKTFGRQSTQWAAFPILAPIFENVIANAFHPHSMIGKTADYVGAGAFAGFTAAFVSYPWDLALTRSIQNIKAGKKPDGIQQIKDYYRSTGFFACLRKHAFDQVHVAAFRMGLTGAFWNLTWHGTQALFDKMHVVADHNPEEKPTHRIMPGRT